uniref:NADH-ubiquinone oxidoreductase chain 2 n=1 Tax=Ceratobaeus sp. MM-2013 TaxID=1429432 RepID=A0A067YF89_9HYME|nr:NADH dehydrogenase subunit 2 [Ceratobaeus sp. MM-2013]
MKMFYFLMIISSILLSLSSKNWMTIWILMELNLFSFIPIMMNKKNVKINNSPMMNYFMIQCFSTMVFIMTVFILSLNLSYSMMITFKIMMNLSILMKLGFYPFYYWMILLMKNISWMNCFILSTMQKFIPMIIVLNLWSNYTVLLILNLINSALSTIGGMNNSNMKMIMAFSSMNHTSWMLLIMTMFESLFISYILIYFMITLSIMMLFKTFNIKSIKNMYSMKLPNFLKMLFNINFISLGGIPPMFGFILKWMSNFLSKLNYFLYFNLMFLMMMSFLTFFYYLMIIMPSIMYFNKSWNKNFLMMSSLKKNSLIFMISFMSLWLMSMNMIIN